MTESPSAPIATPGPADPRRAMQGFLLLDMLVRLFVWASALALACAAFTALRWWPKGSLVGADLAVAWQWGGALTRWIILYNLAYVAILVLLRLPCPKPRPGRYSTAAGAKPDRQLLWSCLLAVLTKARLQAPFPGFLVFHIANLPPMCWLMNPIFGPHSRSVNAADPNVLDPHDVSIGRNVVIGFNATITAHVQDRDGIEFRPTIIEDDVLIGGHSVVPGGVHIGRGAILASSAVLRPNTIIPPNELWGGVPAKKIADLPPV